MAHRVLARLERGQLVAAAVTKRRREVAQQGPRVLAPAVREGRRDEDRAHGVPLARLEEPGHLCTKSTSEFGAELTDETSLAWRPRAATI